MSEVSDAINAGSKETTGFVNYMFTFEDEQKSELTNMIQYSILAIMPIMLILRSVKSLVPEEDESKGCLEISAECVLQIIFIMVSIWVTNRIIRYVPTYSKTEYGKFSPVNFIIPFLIILATMQSKLGFKLNILMERCLEMWHGKSTEGEVAKNVKGGQAQNVNYRAGHEGFANGAPQHQPSQADYQNEANLTGGGNPGMGGIQSQQAPDFNAMYQGPTNPLVQAETPGNSMSDGPMAANSVLGGGFGGSAW